jgi:hypothetical protein
LDFTGHVGPSRFCARLETWVSTMIELANAVLTSFQSFSVYFGTGIFEDA